jgi:hypothetical protein
MHSLRCYFRTSIIIMSRHYIEEIEAPTTLDPTCYIDVRGFYLFGLLHFNSQL